MNLKKKINASEHSIKETSVNVRRVTKVTKGGRRFSFSSIVVAGNKGGIVGFGLGKAKDVSESISKGANDAKKNLISVKVHKDTIPHEVVGKFGSATVMLRPAAPGTGIIAGPGVRIVLENAGVHNVLTKSKGSNNPSNVVRATINALSQLRTVDEIAKVRGVSIDKVFKG